MPDTMPEVTVTLRLTLDTAYRVHDPELSDDESRALFATCNSPTAEHIVVACWRGLEPRGQSGRLTRLRLWETPNNHVDYEGR